MAFCTSCGGAASDDARFCPQCGAEIRGTPAGDAAPVGSADAPTGSAMPPPTGAPMAAGAGLPRNVAAALAYVPPVITGVILLVLDPYSRDPFIRFHAFQSIFFGVAAIVALSIAGFLWFLLPIVWLGLMIVWVLLLVHAYRNERWKLPIVGDLADQQR